MSQPLSDVTNRGPVGSSVEGGLTAKVNAAVSEFQDINNQKGAALAQSNVVDSIANNNLNNNVAAVTNSTVGYDRLMKAVGDLNEAYTELEKAEKVEAGNRAEEDRKQPASVHMSGEDMQLEIEKSMEVLRSLQEMKADADRALSEKVIKRDQAELALKLQNEEFEKKMNKDGESTVAKASKRVEAELVGKEKEYRSKMMTLGEDKTILESLLEGMQKMNGIAKIDVPTEMHGNTLPISVEFTSGVQAVVTLGGDDMRLENIMLRPPLTVGTPTLEDAIVQKLLAECRELPAPNDLRHAMFCLYSAPLAPMKLAEDIVELRKRCLVKANNGPLALEFTTSNGLTASLNVHVCYPNVPAGVLVESLQGGSKWTDAEVEAMRVQANSMCFSTVFFMYDYLCSKD
jgi:hypothetical protein